MRELVKGIVSSSVLLCGLGLWAVSTAQPVPSHSVERLSLFVYDGSNVYEDRRLTAPVSNLPTGLTVSFNETTDGIQNRTWTWTFHNTNTTALNGLRMTGLVDVDLSAPDNNGPDDGEGVTITDNVPAAISSISWTCGGTGSASCSMPSGSAHSSQ